MEDRRKLVGVKQRQKYYYDKQSKPLEPIAVGETVQMRLSGQDTWTPGTCIAQEGPRSYNVKTEAGTYHHNCSDLISTGEPQPLVPDSEEPLQLEQQPEMAVPLQKLPQQTLRPQRAAKPPAWHNDYVMK